MKLIWILSVLSFMAVASSESIAEENTEISPELTRELLLTAIRLLEREAGLKQKSSRLDESIDSITSPVIAPVIAPPCNTKSDNEDDKGGNRRAVGLARNPLTGQLHYAYYPGYAYYPTVYG